MLKAVSPRILLCCLTDTSIYRAALGFSLQVNTWAASPYKDPLAHIEASTVFRRNQIFLAVVFSAAFAFEMYECTCTQRTLYPQKLIPA